MTDELDQNMTDEMDARPEDGGSADDMIVIRKWIVAAVIAGFAGVLIGIGIGYGVGYTTITAANDQQAEELAEMLADAAAGAGGAAQPQPTQPPARLEDVSADDDPWLGADDPEIVIVEFSDFRCPYCQRFEVQTRDQILAEYGDRVRIVFRDFPVVGGQQAAEAAECADRQDAFWEYHEALFASPNSYNTAGDFTQLAEDLQLDVTQFVQCLESGDAREEVLGDYNDGRSYGVSGTPTFFINGVRLIGAQPYENFQAVIEEELGG